MVVFSFDMSLRDRVKGKGRSHLNCHVHTHTHTICIYIYTDRPSKDCRRAAQWGHTRAATSAAASIGEASQVMGFPRGWASSIQIDCEAHGMNVANSICVRRAQGTNAQGKKVQREKMREKIEKEGGYSRQTRKISMGPRAKLGDLITRENGCGPVGLDDTVVHSICSAPVQAVVRMDEVTPA